MIYIYYTVIFNDKYSHKSNFIESPFLLICSNLNNISFS